MKYMNTTEIAYSRIIQIASIDEAQAKAEVVKERGKETETETIRNIKVTK
jgi:hypothetical protein